VTEPALDPRTTGALRRYRVMAIITGSFLLAVFFGFFAKLIFDVPEGSTFDNVTSFIAIAHGWIYVVYLAATIHLWMRMRWGLGRLVVMALGGIVPFLSFVLERRFSAEVAAARAGNLAS
jgi:integral membrane protein